MTDFFPDYSEKTCQTLFNTDVEKIDYALIERALEWIVSGDHTYSREGTVLIFLPGYAEISEMANRLWDHKRFGNYRNYLIIPLHSSLTSEEQSAIFR